jgi:hypothetical protein
MTPARTAPPLTSVARELVPAVAARYGLDLARLVEGAQTLAARAECPRTMVMHVEEAAERLRDADRSQEGRVTP